MAVQIKEYFEKTRQVKITFYEDIEIQDIMKKILSDTKKSYNLT